jgi:hypothetical protein
MGNWYKVTKHINGHYYDYWQRTYRVGKSVKTMNRYIGPASRESSLPSTFSNQYERTVGEHGIYLAKADYTPPPPEPVEPEPKDRKADFSPDEWREIQAYKRQQKRDFDAAMKCQAAAVRKAKRETKGIKALNPFIAKALRED